MQHQTAINLLKSGISSTSGIWADIGAGTGVFTTALRDILTEGCIYAVDKSPHMLWRLSGFDAVKLVIEDGDFNKKMNLPVLDGVIMANALHYSNQHIQTLQNVLQHLKKGGRFILIEYQLEHSTTPWIPFPITFEKFKKLAQQVGLSEPIEIGKVPSQYGHEHIYSCWCEKIS